MQNVFVYKCLCTFLRFSDYELGKILVLFEVKHSVSNLHHWHNVSTFCKVIFRPHVYSCVQTTIQGFRIISTHASV